MFRIVNLQCIIDHPHSDIVNTIVYLVNDAKGVLHLNDIVECHLHICDSQYCDISE